MEDLKVWVVFLGAMALMIGTVLAALCILLLWMLGIADYLKRRNFLCWALSIIVPPFGIFNGVMFEIKKRLDAVCCSNLAFIMAVFVYVKFLIAQRKTRSASTEAN